MEKDAAGNVALLRCTYDPASRGGDAPDGRKVKATLHWVAERYALPAEVRLLRPPVHAPGARGRRRFPRPTSTRARSILSECASSPAWPRRRVTPPSSSSVSYFLPRPDLVERLVFNRTVALRDTWAKLQSRGASATVRRAAGRAASRMARRGDVWRPEC